MSLGFGTSFWWVLVLEQWSNSKKSASIMSNSRWFLRRSRTFLYEAIGITSVGLQINGRRRCRPLRSAARWPGGCRNILPLPLPLPLLFFRGREGLDPWSWRVANNNHFRAPHDHVDQLLVEFCQDVNHLGSLLCDNFCNKREYINQQHKSNEH